MDLVTLRMIAVSLGAVGFIAACGSSPSTANSFGIQPGASGGIPDATTAAETGAKANPAPTSTASSSDEAGPPSCMASCNVDNDCASPCGNGVWCCMQNMCFSPQSGSCGSDEGGTDEGGGGDDSGTAAPAPSM